MPERTTVTILGATGSIGRSTLELLRTHKDKFRITALAAGSGAGALCELAREFQPRFVALADKSKYHELHNGLEGTTAAFDCGDHAVTDAASLDADITICAITGIAGLSSTLAAIRRGKTVAIANKESLVCAGKLIMDAAKEHGTTLLPLDSEHNALFQIYDPAKIDDVTALTLTASGGPFRTWDAARIAAATPAQAVAHPNWSMGAKISVDSATLMNKGLELIEAACLFPQAAAMLKVVVHPQSVIHGMVSYRDGNVVAAMSQPDMKIPISYTLGWPNRLESMAKPLDLTKLSGLTFEEADTTRFPCLRLAQEVLASGNPAAPIVLNAANEIAVAAFLDSHLPLMGIPALVEEALQLETPIRPASITDVMTIDEGTRAWATHNLKRFAA
ncbi:MAG: 1-deoxy-D-xylulose-5-phosphate reductoisomerase [Proteobacteria bacterium]|nr:1-deoxy-D-xylulose-5-phosphate reductoisomerase [Pseudomonadota bacterium]